MKTYLLVIAAALVVMLSASLVPVGAAEDAPAVEASEGEKSFLLGHWRGAKLRCRKEEGKAVRCGKPEPSWVPTCPCTFTARATPWNYPSSPRWERTFSTRPPTAISRGGRHT